MLHVNTDEVNIFGHCTDRKPDRYRISTKESVEGKEDGMFWVFLIVHD